MKRHETQTQITKYVPLLEHHYLFLYRMFALVNLKVKLFKYYKTERVSLGCRLKNAFQQNDINVC